MQYLTFLGGGQIRKGCGKCIAAIEFIDRCMRTLLKNVDGDTLVESVRLGYRICHRIQ